MTISHCHAWEAQIHSRALSLWGWQGFPTKCRSAGTIRLIWGCVRYAGIHQDVSACDEIEKMELGVNVWGELLRYPLVDVSKWVDWANRIELFSVDFCIVGSSQECRDSVSVSVHVRNPCNVCSCFHEVASGLGIAHLQVLWGHIYEKRLGFKFRFISDDCQGIGQLLVLWVFEHGISTQKLQTIFWAQLCHGWLMMMIPAFNGKMLFLMV